MILKEFESMKSPEEIFAIVKLKIDFDVLKDINLIQDFYRIIGATKYFKDKKVVDVSQMIMNKNSIERITEICCSNWKKCKEVKHMTENDALSSIRFDCMNYSPCSNSQMPEDEIWLIMSKPDLTIPSNNFN